MKARYINPFTDFDFKKLFGFAIMVAKEARAAFHTIFLQTLKSNG